MKKITFWLTLAVFLVPCYARAERGAFDVERWYGLIDSVKANAAAQGVSQDVINQTVRGISFIPSIVKSDKNQSELKQGYCITTIKSQLY